MAKGLEIAAGPGWGAENVLLPSTYLTWTAANVPCSAHETLLPVAFMVMPPGAFMVSV